MCRVLHGELVIESVEVRGDVMYWIGGMIAIVIRDHSAFFCGEPIGRRGFQRGVSATMITRR